MTTFERIKELAKKRGLNLREVNDKAGLKPNVIYSWKTKTPSAEKLQSVASLLGVTSDYLLGDTEPTKPAKVDIADDDIIMTYEGREIPKEDLEIIKRLLRRD
ncbi:helix-turn-helix domain-containing protein [Furfurilactobacillus sp. WILCCON 0119]